MNLNVLEVDNVESLMKLAAERQKNIEKELGELIDEDPEIKQLLGKKKKNINKIDIDDCKFILIK
jgi:hypothetical protein